MINQDQLARYVHQVHTDQTRSFKELLDHLARRRPPLASTDLLPPHETLARLRGIEELLAQKQPAPKPK